MSQNLPPQDPIEFFQSLWANAGLAFPPVMPPLEADVLDRKIAELKSVQAWLQTNLAMLQASIQMMEMQKAGTQAMQEANTSSPQAVAEAWLKTFQQYQNTFNADLRNEGERGL